MGVNQPPKGTMLGGNVTMGVEAEESGMDPTYAHFDSTGVMYARTVYDPLAMITFTGDVVPYLAESRSSRTPRSRNGRSRCGRA